MDDREGLIDYELVKLGVEEACVELFGARIIMKRVAGMLAAHGVLGGKAAAIVSQIQLSLYWVGDLKREVKVRMNDRARRGEEELLNG